MLGNKFKDEDKKKVIDFLNLVATKAQFTMSTAEIIQYFKLLSYMQQELLPKIDANVLEVKAVHEAKAE